MWLALISARDWKRVRLRSEKDVLQLVDLGRGQLNVLVVDALVAAPLDSPTHDVARPVCDTVLEHLDHKYLGAVKIHSVQRVSGRVGKQRVVDTPVSHPGNELVPHLLHVEAGGRDEARTFIDTK